MRRLCVSTLVATAALTTTVFTGPAAQSPRATADTPLHDRCGRMANALGEGGSVTRAEIVAAGTFAPPTPPGAQPPRFTTLPGFCRVVATLKPSRDSDIGIEVWMPLDNWNGKFQAVGNGAFNGTIAYPALRDALARGYATASTDTGHIGGSASFALGHPEKVVDFGWRAVHEMTVAAKRVVSAFYERGPRYSYWNGCSAGGRQGMKEAQRFPTDYDGIIAGAPGLDWTGRAALAAHVAQSLERDASARIPAAKAALLHTAVLNACDARDGVVDGVLERPRACTFDPGVLECRGPDAADCLTAPQVRTARLLYASQRNARTQREVPGLERGSELGWTDLGWTTSARQTALDQFRYLVFNDPSWDFSRFSLERDLQRAEDIDDDTLNALDPNLEPFLSRGGKLIQYHGWNDPQISPGASAGYYQRVVAALGAQASVEAGYRLFMVPGMAHCGGGEGPNAFDTVTALEQWVEQGRAPAQIVASQRKDGAVVRTRPLCPYPQVAHYSGTGSTNEAANFVCRTP